MTARRLFPSDRDLQSLKPSRSICTGNSKDGYHAHALSAVGTHKTGTTSFQKALLDHRDALETDGVSVITETHRKFGTIANCLGFAHGIVRDSVGTVARMTGDMPNSSSFRGFRFRSLMRRALKAVPLGGRAIVSTEALCFARKDEEIDRLQSVFRGLDLTVVPIIAFRNEADWRASWQSELRTWSDRMTAQVDGGCEDIRADWYFETDAIHAFWQRLGSVRTVDFDDAVASEGSVLPSLFRACDAAVPENFSEYSLRHRAA